jgi:hypothetical protein
VGNFQIFQIFFNKTVQNSDESMKKTLSIWEKFFQIPKIFEPIHNR